MQATETQYNGHRPQARNGHGAPALTQQLNGTADIESGWSPRLPYNIDVEQALLGAILFDNKAFDRVANFLSPNHFYYPLHGRIFEILATLIHAGKTATPITVKTFLENVEPIDANMTVPQYLGHLLTNATTIICVEDYARTIVHLRTVARLLRGITLGRSGTAELGVATIIEAVRALEKASGRHVGLIVIDTLAKALAGDNENEAAAISAVLSQAALIAERTGAAVLIVHHPGKDTERGMRGSYSLFADADFVLKIDGEKGPNPKTLSIEKSKDDEEGPLGSFILEKFGIGSDRQGNEISSIVVREIARLATSRRKMNRPAPETGNGKALTELEHLVMDGKGQKLTHHDRIPPEAFAVREEIWKAACHRKGLTPSTKQKSRNKAFERAHQALSRAELIGSFDGYVWLIGDVVRKDDRV